MTDYPSSPAALIAEQAKRYAANEAIHIPYSACQHYSECTVSLSYRELDQQVAAAAERWQRAGVAGRVALMLENRAEFFVQWLALNRLGISVIPLNHEMQDEEIPYYLEHGEAHAVCALPEHGERLQRIIASLDRPIPLCTPASLAYLSISDARPVEQSDPNAECALLYTSGSTGKPKGCILSNDYFMQQGIWYRNLDGLISLRDGSERLLTPLPLSHMNAMAVSSMAMFITGGCLIQLDRFHPRSWWQSVRESQATALHYLGVLPAILLALPPEEHDPIGDQIRFGFGAGVNPKHHAAFEARFGFPLLEAWAMTECGAGGAIIANHEPRHVGHCCFGTPSASIEWQLVDEQKRPVPKGEPGELRVRAAGADPQKGFFSGYLHNPEATAEIWQDGWLNTGDVVREQGDGTLCFVDRRKNVIRRSGENISALEVEAALSTCPAIASAIATAVPDELRGDEVALCVVPSEGYAADAATAASIQQFALEQLVYFKAPGWIIFVEEMPVTASNKPKRGDIKSLAREAVASGQGLDLRDGKKRRPAL
jgi:acyl-CoA synthetase (AMP-forming)/AMP-acid ligase II